MKKLFLINLFFAFSIFVDAQNFIPSDPGAPFVEVRSDEIAFGDIDGDNDLDVIIAGINALNSRETILYKNDGTGRYSEAVGTTFLNIDNGDIAFNDIDLDNDLDLIITGRINDEDVQTTLYINDGTGNFSEDTANPLFEGLGVGNVLFFDMDGDGDSDLLISGRNSDFENKTQLFSNDGNGIFTMIQDTIFGTAFLGSADYADVDGDNDNDILIMGTNADGDIQSDIYINDGNGNFVNSGNDLPGLSGSSCDFADIDGDNDIDLFITGIDGVAISSILYINDGNGSYSASSTVISSAFSGDVSFADIDGDSDYDLLLTGLNSQFESRTNLYLNDGNGNFTISNVTMFPNLSGGTITFGDTDSDGDLDLILSGIDGDNTPTSTLFFNQSVSSLNEEFNENSLSIYPNPVSSNLININCTMIHEQKINVSMIDSYGRTILQQNETVAKQNKHLSLDISSLNNGVYFISINDGLNIYTSKLVVN